MPITKGPWRLKVHDGDGKTVTPKSDWTVYGPNGESICFEGKDDHNAADNAQAIAALPELVSCLEAVLEAHAIKIPVGLLRQEVIDAAEAHARALLARLEGL